MNPKPNPTAKITLICFPYAGGGGNIFVPWKEYMPASVELIAVNFPGRGMRMNETPFTQVDTLLPALSNALLPHLQKPFIFFGHSLGALIAFELAHYLRQHYNKEPVHLMPAGRRAPHVEKKQPPIYHLPEKEFIQEVERLNGTPKEVLENPELMELVMPTLRADFEMAETYQFVEKGKLTCPISFYYGLQDKVKNQDNHAAWSQHTNNTYQSYAFPGDHFFLHTDKRQLLEQLHKDLLSISTYL